MDRLTFITTISPDRSITDLNLLFASIRDFGGELADAPILVFLPQDQLEIPHRAADHLASLGVSLAGFEADAGASSFPFGARVQAAYEAERAVAGRTELLAWLDSDTIVISEPAELLLPPGKVLGYRPVHHRLLGTPWGEDLDDFWELAYAKCGAIPDPSDFMVTHDGEKIRPYFNAGSFVIRPEAGLLERWWQTFHEHYLSSDFLPYYDRDKLYPIFMHQVILTGILLAALNRESRLEFSPRINYPLHLHQELPEQLRSDSISSLVTVRCESVLNEPGWQDRLPIQEPLLSWLQRQLVMKKDQL